MKNNRFLLDSDYLEIITKEALEQTIKPGNEHKYIQAEQSAEMSILENLIENYEIENEFMKGKAIKDYDRRINYPVGAYIVYENEIYKVIRAINGYKVPCDKIYWKESLEVQEEVNADLYSQFKTYYPEDLVYYNGVVYECLVENGYDFDNIRIPSLCAWEKIELQNWTPVEHELYEAFSYDGKYYMLYDLKEYDETVEPNQLPQCWGEIIEYDPGYNKYELLPYEYVIYMGEVYYPKMNVNSDDVVIGKNLVLEDPRNMNIKKHMVRISLYHLTKNISPNNVSSIRIADYEESMKWLESANKLKINPMIPRKVDKTGQQITDWGVATFQKSYDPYLNPWHI
ncbi:hypothetical protein DWW91_10900 [Parabacteroides sp. AF17-3]|uniref:hypothetical protein n=1 Tax=Parabacteroides sp. AF17-3 TaxID=2293113 RepID=UPI000EFE3267|nr:hypothetical protein [Parabacteroides sp. AF17-3]RKU69502.1 hypothetical protein DWW91_10900 [Parabacteroides sp. AF17-3]